MLDSLNHISGLCINIYRNFICVPGIWHAAAMLALRTRPSVVVISQLCYNLVFFFFWKERNDVFFLHCYFRNYCENAKLLAPSAVRSAQLGWK